MKKPTRDALLITILVVIIVTIIVVVPFKDKKFDLDAKEVYVYDYGYDKREISDPQKIKKLKELLKNGKTYKTILERLNDRKYGYEYSYGVIAMQLDFDDIKVKMIWAKGNDFKLVCWFEDEKGRTGYFKMKKEILEEIIQLTDYEDYY